MIALSQAGSLREPTSNARKQHQTAKSGQFRDQYDFAGLHIDFKNWGYFSEAVEAMAQTLDALCFHVDETAKDGG